MKAFLIALQFLSRIHLASQSVWRDEDFGRSVLFFPLVGLIIGLLLAALYWASSFLFDAFGRSALVVAFWFYLTGGLPQPVKTPIPWISDTVTLFGASTKRVTVVTPVLTIALVFALVALIKKTKIGMGMRAAAKDFETAQLMGVKINSVISMTFVIGSFLAAVGAMLYFTNYPTVAITSGGMPGLKAFVAAVFGGIGSIPGAVVGAFLIGLCEEIIKGLGQSTFSDAFTFALLIIVLCVKPTGLFGEKVTDKV